MSRPNEATLVAEQLQEHDELLAFADELTQKFTREESQPFLAAGQLDAFALLLDRHFRFEETQGLFSRIRSAFPHLEPRAAALEAEHVRLRGELRQLVALARAVESDARRRPELVQGFTALRTRLLAHEQAERTLLHEAYERDLGDED